MENGLKTVCELNKCTGCMACVEGCPQKAIEIEDGLSFYNAIIKVNKCIKCNKCYKVCQQNNPVLSKKPTEWYQGWTNNQEERKKCSSGGLATAVSTAFLSNGGVVCSCCFRNGKFGFEFAEKTDELQKFVGSKYVKSNPEGIYKSVTEKLKSGQKVLFIALPCQVAALKKFVGEKIGENLYTIDLICHGTPSPKLLDKFLNQYNFELDALQDIQFRVKAKFMVYGDYKGIITNGVSDKYSIAFLNSLTYTENCYSCQYAKISRVSDLTLGDSWGSELSIEEQKKGISLVLSMTDKGSELLQMADVHLQSVDLTKAVANNHQLEHPSDLPKGRNMFFKKLQKGKFNRLVFQQLPKQCLRQDVKQLLLKLKIIRFFLRKKLNYSLLIDPVRNFKY